MSDNIFLRDISFYKRDLNPLHQYVDQSSFYISRIKGLDRQQVRQTLVNKIKAKEFEGQRDPIVQFYERHNYEDREITHMPLSKFLSTIVEENLTTAPSLTCYVHASEKQSILAGFTDENVKKRNENKVLAAKFKAVGDLDKHRHYNGEQENNKLYNNALSGAFSSGGSIVRNPSAHSSLTSTTRTMTSIGNASNERMITGNRHYRDARITLNNIVSLANSCDSAELRTVVTKYGLKIPTVEDVMVCIERSTHLYWRDRNKMARIRQFVETLTDEERVAVVYTGDFYHLRVLNPEFVTTFINNISRKVTCEIIPDPISVIKKTDEMYVNYVHQICITEVRGIGKDYDIITPEQQSTIAATCLNLQNRLIEYSDLIRALFLTRNLPPSVAYIKDSIRRTVVLSDTDSTMFSCDEWVQWYFNDLLFTDEAYAVSGSVMFMATQCIAHSLAMFSANLNVETKKLFMAAMKPEFVFPIFSLTSAGKHYYTYVFIKEGSVYKEMELELKGVHLKNSASPRPLVKDAKKMMEEILKTPMRGEKISLNHWIQHTANIEREIKRSVVAGETTYLGRLNIKSPDAYKEKPEKSNYRYHLFWEQVFAPKYGYIPTPTYAAVKFPTVLGSKRILALWCEQIPDRELASRLISYIERNQRKDMTTIYVAKDYIEAYGVPEEIKRVIAVDDLILKHMGAHRLILETLGFFAKTGTNISAQGY